MKFSIITLFCVAAIVLSGCKKASEPVNSNTSLEAQVLADFPTNLANPNYLDIESKAYFANLSGADRHAILKFLGSL